MKTLIVVPAFNESGSIARVISDLRKFGFGDILVIDDGSVDKTTAVTRKLKVRSVRHVLNRGLGAALGTGFEFARQKGYDCVVTFDADGQHRAKDIKSLLSLIEKKRLDVVIGSRLLKNGQDMPKDRLILNYLSNLATFSLYGVWATDTLSGLRAFNRKAFESIQIMTDRMEVSNEFFKEIKRNKLRYGEIAIRPVYTDYSRSDEQNNSNALANGFKMVLRMFR